MFKCFFPRPSFKPNLSICFTHFSHLFSVVSSLQCTPIFKYSGSSFIPYKPSCGRTYPWTSLIFRLNHAYSYHFLWLCKAQFRLTFRHGRRFKDLAKHGLVFEMCAGLPKNLPPSSTNSHAVLCEVP